MTQLIVPGAAQMRLIWSLSGQLYAINVMGVVNATNIAITQALTNTIGTAVKAAVGSSAFNAAIHPNVALASVGLRDVRSANQPEFIDTGGAVVGTGTGDLLPPQTSLCITLRTAQAGRQFRGRVYLPGYTEAVNTASGTLSAGGSSTSFVVAIQNALIASSLNLGVIHRPTSAPLPVTAGFITVVNAIVLRDLVWDTQRRRAVPGV